MILVVGATGLLGGTITRKLLQEGEAVRMLVRHNSPAAELAKRGLATPPETLLAAGAQPVYGDLKDPPSLAKACAGIDTVITTANSVLRGGADTIETVDLRGTQSLIDAAEEAGVSHFIYVSVMDARINSPNPLSHAKATCEAHLKQSAMAYTILRPGIFMEVWIGAVVGAPLQAGLPVTLVGNATNRHAFVSLLDVADYAVTAVHHPDAQDATIPIGGPEAYSWCDIVAAVGQVSGRPVPVNHVAVGDPVPLLPPPMASLFAGMETFESYIDMADTAVRFGIKPTSLRALSERLFGSVAATA
jgi:NADH dehydrogenase